MEICRSIDAMRSLRKKLNGSVGFVPTMGALHEGHLSLVSASKNQCDFSIASIFVNPIQFNDPRDLKNYPRDEVKDIKLIRRLNVDAVFIPEPSQFYPNNFSTEVIENSVTQGLEGESRPGHFTGVATVLTKFFNIVEPTHSFYGEKDAQQYRVVAKMAADLNYNIKIISCPTVREDTGLAMSSRNENLTPEARKKAAVLYSGLKLAKTALMNGEQDPKKIIEFIRFHISKEPLAEIIYISIADNKTLKEVDHEIESDVLVSIAVNFDNVRLIDNFTYSLSGT